MNWSAGQTTAGGGGVEDEWTKIVPYLRSYYRCVKFGAAGDVGVKVTSGWYLAVVS